jgi:hypothetical protein
MEIRISQPSKPHSPHLLARNGVSVFNSWHPQGGGWQMIELLLITTTRFKNNTILLSTKYAGKVSSPVQINDASPQIPFNTTCWGLTFPSIIHHVLPVSNIWHLEFFKIPSHYL